MRFVLLFRLMLILLVLILLMLQVLVKGLMEGLVLGLVGDVVDYVLLDAVLLLLLLLGLWRRGVQVRVVVLLRLRGVNVLLRHHVHRHWYRHRVVLVRDARLLVLASALLKAELSTFALVTGVDQLQATDLQK
jgi:hypothetical protein